ncbi:cytochrome P450 [Lophiotrema nucula]|uniref:Cytochrome P450 n=1 Tax=Lophiotrema nucula TaxID=690887 RepID=A0A6A5ZM99_9PLEO|nr:cytochrome P450 [Lophiotrema nucula]
MEAMDVRFDVFFILLAPLVLALTFLKTYYTSRLRHLPGPWYSAFTEVVLTWYTVTGRRIHYIHRLHEIYGPVIRISPNAVCLSDIKAFQEVHRIGSGFLKSPWYRKFRTADPSGSIDVFSSIDPRVHGAKRRLLARPFSNTSLRENWEDMVVNKVKSTIDQLKAECKSQGMVDVLKWWTFMTTDMIVQVAFEEDLRMSETGVKAKFLDDLDMIMMSGGIRAELPWAWALFRALTLGLWDPLQGPDDRLREHSQAIMTSLRDRKLNKRNLFFGIQAQEEESSTPHSIAYAAYEGQSLIVAGSGTTAVTLTYLVWAVLKHEEVRRRLEEEVALLPEGYRDAMLEQLPYLNAVIQETLRLYGAAPGTLPRVNNSAPLDTCGYTIPPGTTVNTQSWTLHRNPDVFPEPERFNPDRWLSATSEMKAFFNPFGAGSRTCLGINLAYMELRHSVARFVRECVGARLAETMHDEGMKVQQYFLIAPKGAKCSIVL